jgi:hypothetical protein
MNKPNFLFKVFLFLLTLSAAAASTNIFAQTSIKQSPAEPCYEVILQVLTASNNPGEKNAVPAPLSNTVKKLKALYAFSDYRLTTTFLQRTSSGVEYKSAVNNQNENAAVFSEWALRNLRKVQNDGGKNLLQIENFRFGGRISVTTGASKDPSGKSSPIMNYESIGINTEKFTLSENEPTVIGSLATSRPDELMFLVLTVKSAE